MTEEKIIERGCIHCSLCDEDEECYHKQLKRLEQENESLYEEKNCLHKIIDRLLENSGYSKDIASAEDFEDVYEDMQIKRNELIELEQENKEMKAQVDYLSKRETELISEITDIVADNKSFNEELIGKIAKLENENKELKEKVKSRENELANMAEQANMRINNYRSGLEEILESAKFAQCLPCGSGNLEDCLNCNDDTTNNGQFCMEKRIHDIKTKCVEVLNDEEL